MRKRTEIEKTLKNQTEQESKTAIHQCVYILATITEILLDIRDQLIKSK